ncbi:MAG: 1-deoxy-D-xylulose-5-phosphate synthase [Erysipelotrichaceae bacterium]|nr:1-deoxy-D-xylulose-5-phosphate synthase [Erysipelotrichaceae bacterium]
MKIETIKDPSFLKQYNVRQCVDLAADIRKFLIESISKTGGHLSSNLGVVELTIALHKIFDSPTDKFIFDVGHQSYIHKILTGRASQFQTLRQYHGLSGFQKRAEGPYDPWEAGHSSTSLSAALGMATARDLNHDNYHVIAIIGDGSLTGGMAMEALNNIGDSKHKVIIIFNDNNMSISKNVGGMNKAFSKLRSSSQYLNLKDDVKKVLSHDRTGQVLLQGMKNVRDSIKKGIIQDTIFSEYGIDYLGPINGHNFHDLFSALEMAKKHTGSIVVHVVTKKGMGYLPAQNDKFGLWHGVGKFDVVTGQSLSKTPEGMKSWSEIISDELTVLAKDDAKICAITPAMLQGSKLEKFAKQFPERTFDCGIAEQHAMTFAAGLAQQEFHPFISVYSSFLQRCYDQIHHDVCRMNLPVIIGVDRCGIVGEDGSTHQGIYDISFLSAIPNLIVAQPKNAKEAKDLLYTASKTNRPFAIRYPRGTVEDTNEKGELIPIGSWTTSGFSNKHAIITYGCDVERVYKKVVDNHLPLDVINARFMKPLDEECLLHLAKTHEKLYIYETDCKIGGLGSMVLTFYNDHQISIPIQIFAIGDHFVEHGSIPELRKQEGIDITHVLETIEKEIHSS